MIALALFACSGSDPVDTDVSDSDTDVARFAEPPVAEDLDPAAGVVQVRLVAAPHTWQHGDEAIDGFAWSGSVPGPSLRANLRDTLIVEVENALDEPTTVHWHGLAVPWEMDGVTWAQEPIAPGETRSFSFPLTVAGTFWYHPHFDGARGQVDRGLYGALIVSDPTEPVADRDLLLVFDDGASADDGDGDAHGLTGHAGTWSVDGAIDPTVPVDAGSVVRARLINASDTGYLDLRWPGARVIGGDQGLLAAPGSTLVLAPGDRADVEIDVGSEPIVVSTAPRTLVGPGAGEPVPLFTLRPDGTASAPAPVAWPFSAAPPSTDPPYADVVWVFQGDGNAWSINGEQYPDVTVPEVDRDAVVVIELRNLSATEHPFHLHGHAFEVLSIDGVPPAARTIEDTVNVPIRSVVRVRLVADNPGDWMAHCHILPHAHDGMMTVLRVTQP